MGLGITTPNVVALNARTKGWIAGLQMAALALQKCRNFGRFIRSFTGSHQYLFDYLGNEVFYDQPANVQRFLLTTSILHCLSGPLCDATTGRRGSQALLERLYKANLFLIPLDEERRWYRYHPLFGEFLREHLYESYGDQVSELHLRACEWYEHEGMGFKAVEHALAVGAFERAGRLIEPLVEMALSLGEWSTLHRWLGVLPDELISRADLSIARAVVLYLDSQFDPWVGTGLIGSDLRVTTDSTPWLGLRPPCDF